VLALDQPGTGEAALSLELTADCDDLTDGIIELARADPALDESRVVLIGFSLGGALAVHAAAGDRRIAAVVAVTPPYDAVTWLPSANPLLAAQLAALAPAAATRALIDGFALPSAVQRLRCPLLVIGAGRDVIVPPGEAARLCAAAGDLGTLLWFPDAGHGVYDDIAGWTDDAARWLVAVMTPPPAAPASTGVDSRSESLPPPPAPLEPPLPPSETLANTP
jgi:pimeloyl-ACP methyl ester carboxylesterase